MALNLIQYLLVCLGEEAVEVAHRAAKSVRFGVHECNPKDPTKDNAYLVAEELTQLLAVYAMLVERGAAMPLGHPRLAGVAEAKRAAFDRYAGYSAQLGILQQPEDHASAGADMARVVQRSTGAHPAA